MVKVRKQTTKAEKVNHSMIVVGISKPTIPMYPNAPKRKATFCIFSAGDGILSCSRSAVEEKRNAIVELMSTMYIKT